jgi:hypothetical protein
VTRATPELIALYRRRANRLRAEACRQTWRSLWEAFAKVAGKR